MQELAQRLWEARRGGTLVEVAGEAGACRIWTMPTASRKAAVRASGHARAGWKVGSTSAEARRKLGTDRPGAGALLEPFCFESGAEVPVFAAHAPAVEGEFVFVMGEGLPPREAPFEREDVMAAVMGVAGRHRGRRLALRRRAVPGSGGKA